jgi:hypothetical protein
VGETLSNLWITTCFFWDAALRCALYPQDAFQKGSLEGSTEPLHSFFKGSSEGLDHRLWITLWIWG